jgi:lipopolysaccharide transport system ATP-binding protein
MPAIEVLNLSKCFPIYTKPFDRIREALSFSQRQLHKKFWALKDVSFSIPKGVSVGVIGQNGSGKSTLLKILAGLMLPSAGEVRIHGKVSSLIELGMGFHPEFSGRSNVYLNSAFLGLQKEEIDAKFNEVVEFSGMKEFIDRPVKTYSTGMYLRLAFSVAISVNPEIFLIDEILAVGDALFSQKCIKKLKEFQERETTILFVSHNLGSVKSLCDEAMLMDQGTIIDRGHPEDVSNYYLAIIQKRYAEEMKESTFIQRMEDREGRTKQRYGNFDAMITTIQVLNSSEEEIGGVLPGETCIIRVTSVFFEDVENGVIGILIKDKLGNEIYGTNTGLLHRDTGPIKKGEAIEVDFTLAMNIGPGDYSITAAVHPDAFGLGGHFDWIDKAVPLKVMSSEQTFIGVSKLSPDLSIRRVSNKNNRVYRSIETLFPHALSHIEMKSEFQQYLIKGWHEIEKWPEGEVRWTEKESVFILRTSGSKIKYEVCSLKPDLEKEAVRGRIFCNGEKIGDFSLEGYGWKIIEHEIGEKFKGRTNRWKLILNQTWRPNRFYNNGDQRDLGICVKRIWCED